LESEGGIWPDRSRRWWVAFSGRLRNRRTLVDELLARDRITASDEDGRIIAEIIAEAGFERGLGRLQGELAIVAWGPDGPWIARDRLGHRRLYRWTEGAATCVGTRPPDRPLSPRSIQVLLEGGIVPAPSSLWEGVEQLGAGQAQKLGQAPISTWTPRPPTPGFGGARNRWARTVDYGLDLAVRTRTEGPVGILEGGGLYSQAILRVAARRDPERIVCYSFGGVGEGKELALRADQVEGLLAQLADFPEPLVDPQALLLLVAAQQGSSRLVGGWGAAELMGEEPSLSLRDRLRRRAGGRRESPWPRLSSAMAPMLGSLSEQTGVEFSAPFLDPSLVDVLASVPEGLLHWGARGMIGGIVGGELPSHRPIELPLAAWLSGPLAGSLKKVEDQLEGCLSPEMRLSLRAGVGQDPHHHRRLWSALVLAVWRQRHEG
jgi:asparagine synthetase B (glutamine-hydrolysing)